MTTVSIPDTVTSIGAWAFGQCTSLSSIKLPIGLTLLMNSILKGCTSLTSISIPKSVMEIRTQAFTDCSSLATIDFSQHEDVPALASISVFAGLPNEYQILVPQNLLEKWRTSTNWASLYSHIVGV